MTDKNRIIQLVNEKLDEGMFLVDVQVNASNIIRVYIDSFDGITIDQCVAVSRHIEQNLDRDNDDFELQVSSPGLTEPLKVHEQYQKNKGRQIEVELVDGKGITGELKDTTSDFILIETSVREKVEGHKKKQLIIKEHQIEYSDIRSAKVVVSFK